MGALVMQTYVLDDAGNPVIETDIARWGEWFERSRRTSYHGDPRRVAISQIAQYRISTVFLASDHSFGAGPPVLWETMVFGSGAWDQYQERYTSRADALARHQRICELILAGKDPC